MQLLSFPPLKLSGSKEFNCKKLGSLSLIECLTSPAVVAVGVEVLEAETLGTAEVVAVVVVGDGDAVILKSCPSVLLSVVAVVITVATSVVTSGVVVVVIEAVVVIGVAVVIEAVAVVGLEVPRALESSSELDYIVIPGTLAWTNPPRDSEGNAVTPPDATVIKTEDALAKALVGNYQKKGKNLAQAYPDRPGYGTLGRPVTLYANYLPFTSVGKPIYRYHVSIAAEGGKEPAGRKARRIVRLLLEEHFPDNLNSIATDYRSTLISVSKLKDGIFDVRYKDESDVEYPESPKVFKVTTQHTGDINPADLINYLTSTNAGELLTSKPEIIQALNLILGHHPKTNREVVSIAGNRHYSFQENVKESASLEGGLEVLRGFFVSVRAATARVLLNVQVKYLACYEAGPLAKVIGDWQYSNRGQKHYRLEAFLKRMRVCITHIKRKDKNGKPRPARVKTISGFATPQDGGSDLNRPKVEGFGAGPHGVKFFLEAPGSQSLQSSSKEAGGKGKKGKKAPPKAGPAPAGQFVSVADFFKKGE